MTTALRVANCERLSRLPAHLDALCTAPRAPRQTDFCYPRATSVFDHLADDVVPRESIKVEKPLEVCIDLKTANSTLVHNASGKHFPSNEIPVADIGTTAFTASLTDSPKSRQVLVIVVRADPVICGHSTEARNLAEVRAYVRLWCESVRTSLCFIFLFVLLSSIHKCVRIHISLTRTYSRQCVLKCMIRRSCGLVL
jgi:hypothetical protein